MHRTLVALVLAALGAVAVVVPPNAAGSSGRSGLGSEVHAAEIGTQPREWSAADYDGVALTADHPDDDSLPKVHAVYMHAADRPSVFADYAAMFQSEHDRASDFLTHATGMAFRWDKRRSQDGRLLDDITVVRSRFSYSKLTGRQQFTNIGESLKDAGLTDPDKKYYVWLDAGSQYCGQAQGQYDAARSADNPANASSYAVSYRLGGAAYEALGGWCNPVLHELLHGMGALGPHMPNYESGHCNDDANDVMCNIASSPGGAIDRNRPRTLDGGVDRLGNDDYLDPAADLRDSTGRTTLPWWTVNLSRFLCPRSAADPTVPDCSVPNAPFGAEAEPTPTEPTPPTEPSPSPSPKRGGKR